MKNKKNRVSSRRLKTGVPPGTVVFVGEQKTEESRIDLFHYTKEELTELSGISTVQAREFLKKTGFNWINISGLHNTQLIEEVGKLLNIHPLTLEDVVNTKQRPKVEEFQDYIFVAIKMISFNESDHSIDIEHLSLILGDNYVISFQEKEGDVFNGLRTRLKNPQSRLRSKKSDYLLYSLMDSVIDHYFLTIENLGDYIDELNDQILADPMPDTLQQLHSLKREILRLRRAIRPLREMVGILDKSESHLLCSDTDIYFRDLFDHTYQVMDIVENFRDSLNSMHDTYLSVISNRMNEIMKVLTIIATIFIPLTFIAGVYGMNFEFMPELKWRYGYAMIWGIMIITGIGLIIYFRKKKWL